MFWRTIRVWLFRRSAARREFTPRAMPAECHAEDRVASCCARWKERHGDERRARFVCVIALARQGRVLAVISDFAEGMITDEPRGTAGFGYDPVFLFPELGRTFAELAPRKKPLQPSGEGLSQRSWSLWLARNTLTPL